jgi:hypothetical protein
MIEFEPAEIPKDAEGMRTCGCCLESKPVTEFYKDGTDNEGKPRYRRDCKVCYRVTRLSSRRVKRKPATPPAKGRRKK